jgi:hypothetical protein
MADACVVHIQFFLWIVLGLYKTVTMNNVVYIGALYEL